MLYAKRDPFHSKEGGAMLRPLTSLKAVLGFSVLSWGTLLLGADPQVIQWSNVRSQGIMSQPFKVYYQHGETLVVPPSDEEMNPEDFDDLYIVETGLHFAPPSVLEEQGKLLQFVPGKFALIRLDQKAVEKVVTALHGETIACGVLLKLNGDFVATEFASIPDPLVPLESNRQDFIQSIDSISSEKIKENIDKLTAFPSRFHKTPSGKQIAEFLQEQYQKLAGRRQDVTFQIVDHGSQTPQKSLIVRLEGKKFPNETLIFGSHLDSVNWRGDAGGKAPGADDNASGTATNLEIFRVLMARGIEPDRTLEFHAYAAEEIGLVGSQDIAQRYKKEERNVLAMIQHDMTLWKSAQTKNKIWFVTNNTDQQFNRMLGSLVDKYVGIAWQLQALSGGSSDHASWRRAGYVTAFPFENPTSHNPAIHTSRDTVDQAPYFDLAADFAKLGLSFALHFGGVDEETQSSKLEVKKGLSLIKTVNGRRSTT